MTCYYPLKAYRTGVYGDYDYSFKEPRKDVIFSELGYPCGVCVGCVKAHRSMWSMRLVHESYYHDVSAFLTLTYDDKHVPSGEIPYDHFQSFRSRLRSTLDFNIRYFVAAEYGSRTARPHFHAVIFGYYPDDVVEISSGYSKLPLFKSRRLLDLWGRGHVSCAPFSPATAGYVAGYVTKKVLVKDWRHQRRVAEEAFRAGREYIAPSSLPEYHKSSTRPGLGHDWLMQYHRDVLRDGYIVYSGHRVAIPRYYRKLLAKHWPDEYRDMVFNRDEHFAHFDPESTVARMDVREQVDYASVKNFHSRSL